MDSRKKNSPKTSSPKKKTKKKRFSKKKLFIWTLLTGAVAIFCALALYLVVILNGEKMLNNKIDMMDLDEASIMYDADGKEIDKLYRQNRENVSLTDMPKMLQDAFIATEDRRFREHEGVDLWAIGRALVTDVVHRSAVEGGSTITQQLAKNLFLSSDKTLFRKGTEVSMALALENNYSKDEILEMYLNRIYFGKGTYGVKAAAEYYFGKSIPAKKGSELTLAEMATLAGMPKAPGNYNPVDNPVRAKERRAVVLKLLYDQRYISKEEMNAANAEPFHLVKHEDNSNQFATYKDYVIQEATEVTGLKEDELYRGGFKIYTNMNAKAQQTMEAKFNQAKLFPEGKPDQIVQGSMVIVDQHDGGIVAMIGGRGYRPGDWNRAVKKTRQPGSSFKPIVVYGPALETGEWKPYSKLVDKKMSFGDYNPHNYDSNYRGEVTMALAVKKSINIPAVWLLDQIGVTTGMNFAENLGIDLDPKKDRNLSIALGGLTHGVSPLQMAQAYSAFANNGIMNQAHAISRILDNEDHVLYEYKPQKEQVMSEQTAYSMTQLMQGVVESGGTGVRAAMERPVAGKTGSTQVGLKGINSGYRDIWFCGYTPEWTAAIWMGYDNTDPDHYLHSDSGQTAAMFKAVMSEALAGYKIKSFTKPKGVKDMAPEKPAAVSDLTAAYDDQGKQVALGWSAVKDTKEYRVYRKKAEDKTYSMILNTSNTSIVDLTIEPDSTYQYYVTAVHSETNLESDKSNIAQIAVPASEEQTTPDDQTGTDGSGNSNDGSDLPDNGGIPNGGQGTTDPSDGGDLLPAPGNNGGGGGANPDQNGGDTQQPDNDSGVSQGNQSQDANNKNGGNGTIAPILP